MKIIIKAGGIGIYFLLLDGEIVYVGRTKDFLSRMAGHKKKNFDSVRFIPCEKSKLAFYEDRWINKFKPPYNLRMAIKKEKSPKLPKSPKIVKDLFFGDGKKRTLLIVDISPEFKRHLVEYAEINGIPVSKLVRKALEKVTKYKEKAIV